MSEPQPFTHCDHGVRLTDECAKCSEPKWTVLKFIELLKRHDSAAIPSDVLVCDLSVRGGGVYWLSGWLALENLVADLNKRERQP